ncbi:hypothetical protein BLA29_013518, partial [Euroglyphus maynei]
MYPLKLPSKNRFIYLYIKIMTMAKIIMIIPTKILMIIHIRIITKILTIIHTKIRTKILTIIHTKIRIKIRTKIHTKIQDMIIMIVIVMVLNT